MSSQSFPEMMVEWFCSGSRHDGMHGISAGHLTHELLSILRNRNALLQYNVQLTNAFSEKGGIKPPVRFAQQRWTLEKFAEADPHQCTERQLRELLSSPAMLSQLRQIVSAPSNESLKIHQVFRELEYADGVLTVDAPIPSDNSMEVNPLALS